MKPTEAALKMLPSPLRLKPPVVVVTTTASGSDVEIVDVVVTQIVDRGAEQEVMTAGDCDDALDQEIPAVRTPDDEDDGGEG